MADTKHYAEHGTKHYASETARGCEEAGEPVFLLRAQDVHAPQAVRAWASAAAMTNPAMAEKARRIAYQMQGWPHRKEPD